jgi:hypothetical protein
VGRSAATVAFFHTRNENLKKPTQLRAIVCRVTSYDTQIDQADPKAGLVMRHKVQFDEPQRDQRISLRTRSPEAILAAFFFLCRPKALQ